MSVIFFILTLFYGKVYLDLLDNIPEVLIQFVIVLLFSLLIGLEQRKLHNEKANKFSIFGTDRTFTFIGILGFILYISEPGKFSLFIAGAVILGILFGIYYFKKIDIYRSFGLTNIIVAFITYSLPVIIITQPRWFSILVVVSILILVELKSFFQKFTSRLDNNEFITLAKFLIIAGIVLPIIPADSTIAYLNISPYVLWITVVAVSSISYLSYLHQKFVFRKSGLMISGLLGGLYSSTATTVVLSRKSKEQKTESRKYPASIIAATAMMYLRILILMLIFNNALGRILLPYSVILILLSVIISGAIYLSQKKADDSAEPEIEEKNPLELKIAVLFSVLFILFGFITNYTLNYFGEGGLNVLSYIVGFTDIDPYLLNLFQGKYDIGLDVIAKATFQAIISNNVLKIFYVLFLGGSKTKKIVTASLGLITLINIILLFLL